MSIPPAASTHRSWLHLAALAGALSFAGAVGQASAQAYEPGSSSSDLGQICRSVVGASPGEAHYVGCVQSLSASREAFDHDRALGMARADCLNEGLRPGTPTLAQCTLSRSRSVRAPEVRAQADRTSATKSYFYASPSEAHRREETSCASLGLDPASGGFASCVANMQSAMFAVDNPL